MRAITFIIIVAAICIFDDAFSAVYFTAGALIGDFIFTKSFSKPSNVSPIDPEYHSDMYDRNQIRRQAENAPDYHRRN